MSGGIWSIHFYFFLLQLIAVSQWEVGGRAIHENMGGYFYSQGVRENFLSMAQNLQPVKVIISTSDYKNCSVFSKLVYFQYSCSN